MEFVKNGKVLNGDCIYNASQVPLSTTRNGHVDSEVAVVSEELGDRSVKYQTIGIQYGRRYAFMDGSRRRFPS